MNPRPSLISSRPAPVNTRFPKAFKPLFEPARHKVFYGGRGSGKTFNIAKALVSHAYKFPLRILCARQFQVSLKDSVHAALVSAIKSMELWDYFKITKEGIVSKKGAEFIFVGFGPHPDQTLKSLDGIDICWVEEAHSVTLDSWRYLEPTIRSEGRFPWLPRSEIWVSFNQHDKTDPTYERFVTKKPPGAVVVPVTWQDNPYFPKVLNDLREYDRRDDPDAYDWVWGLSTRRIGSSVIFNGRYTVHPFDEPTDPPPRIYFGLDFGFSVDPTAAIRCYVTKEADGEHLWISHEAFAHEMALDDIPCLFRGGTDRNGTTWPGMPNYERWPIKADNSRPETIHHLMGLGLYVLPAAKWDGSVEDGIDYLKRYRQIHIHERCKRFAQEARLYSYKVDKKTGDVLPQVLDKHNHGWDGLRYSLDGVITRSGAMGVWSKLARAA